MEICLTFISICALIAVLRPATAFYIESATYRNISLEVLSKIKPEINPCDDFYQFACGKYIDEVAIPDEREMLHSGVVIEDILAEQLKVIITEERPSTDPKHLQLPNIFYKACMNLTRIEELGATPIQEISDAVGGWPLIKGEAWDSEDKWSWQDTEKRLRKLGLSMNGILEIELISDARNNTNRNFTISPPLTKLFEVIRTAGMDFNNTMENAYHNYMVDIAVLFGADREKAKEEFKEVMEFTMTLVNITMQGSGNWYDNYHSRTIKQLQEMYPYVQWLDYINALLPEEAFVDENEPICVVLLSFFEDLGPLLVQTPKRVIANYIMWQIHEQALPFLSEQFHRRHLQYEALTTGVQNSKPRWKECVAITTEKLGISVGSLYVQRYFKEDSKAIVGEMVSSIRSSFGDILNEVIWMDDITKQEAKKKLHSMVAHIGYPDELLDNSKLAGYYRKLEIDPDKYFVSSLKINSFDDENVFKKLRLPVNKTDWETHSEPTTINAYYYVIENSLMVTAGILQGNFFNANRPHYMNYGAMGFFIGHEITHGFDDVGRLHDKDGNLFDWWQPNTKKVFQDKVTCIREEYGNYTDSLTGLKLNGNRTLNENIADNSGLKVAYKAYRKWAAANGPEPKLPNLDYTPDQMFWISAAQALCAKYREQFLLSVITTEIHSPERFRVLGAFRNMKDFSKDFHCPVDSPMNPVHKCEVW